MPGVNDLAFSAQRQIGFPFTAFRRTRMDQGKIEALTDRIVGDVGAAMTCLTTYLGHRLGLFRALAESGPMTSVELAAETGYQERYLREWLECMTVNDYLTLDDSTGRFALPREHAVALLDVDNPAYA